MLSLLFTTGIAVSDLLRGGGAATDARRAESASGIPGHDFCWLSSTGLHPDLLCTLADTDAEEAVIDSGAFTTTRDLNSSEVVRFLDNARLLTSQ